MKPFRWSPEKNEFMCAKAKKMPKTDACESKILAAYEKGSLKSVATKPELAKFKAAARATAIKDRRVNKPKLAPPKSAKSHG
jgi:hypothetical protein